MIHIHKLSRRYGSTLAVSDVNVEIGRGEIVGLLGHNGAGKTTVMKVLTGFLEPSEGQVTVDGHDVVTDRQAAQRLIGYLPENAPVYAEMLVQDYLVMMAGLRGVPSDQVERAVGEAVRDTGLQDRLLQPIGTLSKGLRQRVGIAQAIVHKPAVLVLDEPTNGLDPMQIQSIRQLIRRLGQRTTILLSTHILQEIEAVCDRVLVMIGGRLVADAPLARLTSTRAVRLSVPADTPRVEEVLGGITNVTGVRRAEADTQHPGFVWYTVACADGAAASPAIARAANQAGWAIAAVAPEHVSLEQVFKRLEHEHADRLRQESAR